MLSSLKSEIEDKLTADLGIEVEFTNKEFRDALDEVGRDLIYNYFIFQKDVTYKDFLENLTLYLKLCSQNN